MNPRLALLIVCQGLYLTNNVTLIAINGLVGLALAPYGWMATLPVMGYVVGGALAAPLVARVQRLYGRKVGFVAGALVAAVAALLGAYAVVAQSFVLVLCATLLAGYFNANAQLYRFAAAELVGPAFKEKAVSWVLAGGLLGAVAGPNLANWSRDWVSDAPFAAAYLILSAVGVLGAAVLSFIEFAPQTAAAPNLAAETPSARPLAVIMRQAAFLLAATVSALSYGVMNLLMAATPLAMQVCGYAFSDAAWVLQWHVVAMFAPGFFTGNLIQRFGAIRVMWAGLALNVVCAVVALSGIAIAQFLWASVLLGLGWNFLFTAATTWSLKAFATHERDTAQGALNFCVFGTLAVSSFASGALFNTQGWQWLNWGAFVPLALIAAALLRWGRWGR